jgi:RNA polymerase sigma-70 factor (ECF subfamily)
MSTARPTPELHLVRDGEPKPPSDPVEAAYRAYASYVAAVAFRVLGRDIDVDDVVQEVFLAAARGLTTIRDAQATQAWLRTITLRLAHRKLRGRRVLAFFGLDPQPDYGEQLASGASPEHRATLARVYRLLDQLPPAQRIAWTLRYVEGEQLEDVARLCECSLATAKRRITTAQQLVERGMSDATE